ARKEGRRFEPLGSHSQPRREDDRREQDRRGKMPKGIGKSGTRSTRRPPTAIASGRDTRPERDHPTAPGTRKDPALMEERGGPRVRADGPRGPAAVLAKPWVRPPHSPDARAQRNARPTFQCARKGTPRPS